MLIYVVFFGYYFILPLLGNAPYYPSSKKAMDDMLKLADLKGDEKIVDLGSGDGRLIFHIAPFAASAAGIEHNPFFVLFCRFRNLFRKDRKKIKFVYSNFYKTDLSKYDVIFCYLLPESMRKLEKKMKKELKPGTKIISNTFHIEEFKEAKKLNKIKLYVVK